MHHPQIHSLLTPCSLCHAGLPDPPVKVELCDWDVDHMDLQWMFPPSDGGAPILLYKVRLFEQYVLQCSVSEINHCGSDPLIEKSGI